MLKPRMVVLCALLVGCLATSVGRDYLLGVVVIAGIVALCIVILGLLTENRWDFWRGWDDVDRI